MINKKDFSKIGIGTWGIGGLAEQDPNNNDEKQVKALVYMLKNGMNFVEMCPWYAEWKAVDLFIQALNESGKDRDNVFLIGSIYPHRNHNLREANGEFENLLKRFNTNHIDTVQYTLTGLRKWGLKKSLKLLRRYLNEGLTRFVSITNSDFDTLKLYKQEFGNKFFSHEVQFNFEIRENENFGLIKYAEENNIKNVVYQPLRRNRTAQRNWPLLVEISEKYEKTQNQIIMNWLVTRGFFPITKSETISHIDEILRSLDFTMDREDVKRLNDFKLSGYKSPKIDWDKTGDGISVSQLSNVFDDLLKDKQ